MVASPASTCKPGLPVEVGVQSGLEEANGNRAFAEDFARPLHALGFQLIDRDDGVDQPHVERLLRVVLAAQIPDFARLLLPDNRGQIARAVAAVEAADFRPGLPENGVVGGNRQVADDVQDVPAADGVARHQRDHGLGHGANDALKLQHVEARHAVIADVARVAAHLLVAARAEGVFAIFGGAVPREQDDADFRVRPRRA